MSMAWIAVGTAVVGAGASIYGAKKSAGATSSASQRAIDAENKRFEEGRADLAPYRQAGYGALDMISQLYGIPGAPAGAGTTGNRINPANTGFGGFDQFGNPRNGMDLGGAPGTSGVPATAPTNRDLSAFYTSPNYDFVRSEGLRGVTNSRAAQGSGSGGNALRGSIGFASNLASGEFQNYVDRLFAVAGLGSGATTVGVQAGQNNADSLAQIYQHGGDARASAYMAGAQGVNSAVQGGLGNWAFNNYLNQGNASIAPQGGYAYGGAPGNRNP
jgi:hypothetical protein